MSEHIQEDGTLIVEPFVVSKEGWDRFVDALANPKTPVPKLVALMREGRTRRGG